MKIIVIIQARIGSSRLPSKVLMKLGGKSVISHVIDRCKDIPGVDTVCVALPKDKENDILVDTIKTENCYIYRGDEMDVLSRYADAARELRGDIVMRITADKPLIDPQICGKVLELLINKNADFSCNNMPASWPHGLDCEVFTSETLFSADKNAVDTSDREHVTPWMRRNKGLYCVNLDGPGGKIVDLRLTLDYKEDFAFLNEIFKKAGPSMNKLLYEDVMEVLELNPELLNINHCWSHLSRYAET